MAEQNYKTIIGKVDRIVYHDKDSGRAILSIVREDGKSARVIGTIAKIEKDETITAVGFWRKDEKYGWQFVAEAVQNSSCLAVDDGIMKAIDFSNLNQTNPREFRNTQGICNYTRHHGVVQVFVEQDGAKYSRDKKTLISVSKDTTVLEIPETVTTIGTAAFKDCQCLSSVTIGSSVTTIGEKAFADCSNLKSVRISDIEAWCRIKFMGADSNPISIAHTLIINGEECNKLVIPESVKSISDYAFHGCTCLVSVALPQGLEKIGEKAFANCHNLENLIVPASVTLILSDAFSGCKNYRIDREFDISWSSLTFMKNSILAAIIDKDYSERNTFHYEMRSYESYMTLKADFDGVDDTLNDVKDIIKGSVPSLKIRMLSMDKCEIINADQLKKAIFIDETRDISINDVDFDFYELRIKTPWGNTIWMNDRTMTYNLIHVHRELARLMPVLRVHFPSIVNAEILNINELHEITGVLDEMKVFSDTAIPERLKEIRIKYFRSLLPQTMSSYIKFLYEKHPICIYPIIPVCEDDGGSMDMGALFTVIIGGQPHIIWESFKESKATYVFPCTNDNYEEKRELIYNYLRSYKDNKRSFLRSNSCAEMFGEKPRMLVHNDFTSWEQRLMYLET